VSELNKQWTDAQEWEKSWWHNSGMIHDERYKSSRVWSLWGYGLKEMNFGTVVDLGCGPCGILTSRNANDERFSCEKGYAVDPIDYSAIAYPPLPNVEVVKSTAEDFYPGRDVDATFIYNCLQHTIDPGLILAKARSYSKEIYIFEWINIPPYQGHLHTITSSMVENAFHGMTWKMHTVGWFQEGELNGQFVCGIYTRK
jgi:hypothetical protein